MISSSFPVDLDLDHLFVCCCFCCCLLFVLCVCFIQVLFVCVHASCPSQLFFSHVKTFSSLPGLDHSTKQRIKCLAQGHNTVHLKSSGGSRGGSECFLKPPYTPSFFKYPMKRK